MRRFALLFLTVASAQACGDSAGPSDPMTPAGAAGSTGISMPGQPIGMGGSGGTGAPLAGMAAPLAGSSGATAGASGAAAGAAAAGSGGSAGVAGTSAAVDAGPAADSGAASADAAIDAGVDAAAANPADFAGELNELFLHDACTGEYAPQPDTCLHELKVEHEITFGGKAGTVYDVTLRVRGLFEPTTISGGQVPVAAHPYFKVGGTVSAADYSHWHIDVANPKQTYWLNHYPSTSHTIYQEDFEATLSISGGSKVVVGVADGNDREIDNAETGIADRRQLIAGVTDEVMDGQMLRLDVISVEEH